jgi:hypothetical protein
MDCRRKNQFAGGLAQTQTHRCDLKECPMKYLFFAFVLNVCACAATGTAHAPANTDDADRLKALAVFGVTSTGTGYIGEDSLMSIQCVPSGSDATTDTKAALRSARDEVIKMRCGSSRTGNFFLCRAVFRASRSRPKHPTLNVDRLQLRPPSPYSVPPEGRCFLYREAVYYFNNLVGEISTISTLLLC